MNDAKISQWYEGSVELPNLREGGSKIVSVPDEFKMIPVESRTWYFLHKALAHYHGLLEKTLREDNEADQEYMRQVRIARNELSLAWNLGKEVSGG